MRRQFACILIILTFLLLLLSISYSQESDELITIDTPATEDLYLAGRSIHILSTVEGDVVAAAWRVAIDAAVSGDVIAAAERVTVRSSVGDDIRAAGREVSITGQITDDAILAGETVTLAPETMVGGRAWLAGRHVEIAGRVGKELRAAGQAITISGFVDGNVQLMGETIEILPGAHIVGDLIYRSDKDALISAGAKIDGRVERIDMELLFEEPDGSSLSIVLGLLLSLMLTAVVVFLLLPQLSLGAVNLVRCNPLKCLGLGFIVLVIIPMLVLVLLITLLGIPLGLTLLALYFVVLLFGFLIGIYFLSDMGVRWLRKETQISKGWRVLSIIIAVIILMLIQLIPILGFLVALFLFLFGLGALTLIIFQSAIVIGAQS